MHRIESLESRQLLSGDVTAWVSGGSLTIMGDQADNQLLLTADPSQQGQISLDGENTTINGQRGPISFKGVVRNVRIYLGDGADSILISNANFARDLAVFGNKGDDQVLLDTVQINGNLTIDTADGTDTVDLASTTVKGRTVVNTGVGADIFTAEGSTFRRQFLLNVGAGDNQIFTDSVNFFGGKVITPIHGKSRTNARMVTKHYDFRQGTLGWTGGYSDYNTGMEDGIGFVAEPRQLPAELRTKGTGYYVKTKNIADDLFVYLTKRLGIEDGLRPNQTYQVRFVIRFASNAPSHAMGIGGAPGESVWLKAGASKNEPTTQDTKGRIDVNIDHGEQGTGGTAASTVGNIANGKNQATNTPYVSLVRRHLHPYLIQTDANGNMHLVVGTESGFEGETALYYQQIDVQLIPVNLPSQEKDPTPPKGDNSGDSDVHPV
jgi:hypothetical protein